MLYLQKICYMRRRIYLSVNQPDLSVTRNSTGEIVGGISKRECSDIDEYIMFFLASLPKIEKLDGNALKVLMWCWKLSSWNPTVPDANTVTNDKAFKETIRKNGSELTDPTINKAIHELAKTDFLIKRCKGSYFLNPNYFFKGTLTNRAKLQYQLSYDGEQISRDEAIRRFENENK